MKYIKRVFFGLPILLVVCFWTPTASAQSTLIDEEEPDRWRSTLFVYLWGLGMDGSASVRGNEVDVDASFSDLIEFIDAAISFRFESQKRDWGYFLDGFYSRIKPSEQTPIGEITLDTKSWIAEAGGVYHFNRTVQGLFGLRYQALDTQLRLPNRTVGDKPEWIDAFAGIRVVPV